MEHIWNDDDFCEAVRALTPTAYAVAWVLLHNDADCEDAMSAAVLKAYEKRGSLRIGGSFRAWFIRILKNEAYDILRHRSRVVSLEGVSDRAAAESAPDPNLSEALLKLPEAQRIALVLQCRGYSLEETAQILRIPVGTVKSRLSRAKTALRTHLKGE